MLTDPEGGQNGQPSVSEVLSSILIVRHSAMQRPRPAARLPAHATFSMLKHAERLIQRPAEASSIKSPPHGREGGGKSGEKANESLPQSHRAGRISNCPPMPTGQTSSTASPTLPACLLEELLLQQQLLAGGSDYIRDLLCEGECTERKSSHTHHPCVCM